MRAGVAERCTLCTTLLLLDSQIFETIRLHWTHCHVHGTRLRWLVSVIACTRLKSLECVGGNVYPLKHWGWGLELYEVLAQWFILVDVVLLSSTKPGFVHQWFASRDRHSAVSDATEHMCYLCTTRFWAWWPCSVRFCGQPLCGWALVPLRCFSFTIIAITVVSGKSGNTYLSPTDWQKLAYFESATVNVSSSA